MYKTTCPYCGCTEFDETDYGGGLGTSEQSTIYTCMNCDAQVTVYECDREPHWEPPEDIPDGANNA